MFKSALDKIRLHVILTTAAAVSTVVAVVALGFTVFYALRLVVIPVAASALTAAIFLALAVAALIIVQHEPKKPPVEEPPAPVKLGGLLSSIDWNRWGPLAGEVGLTLIGMIAARAGKGRSRRS
jgi:hypothetical protein